MIELGVNLKSFMCDFNVNNFIICLVFLGVEKV